MSMPPPRPQYFPGPPRPPKKSHPVAWILGGAGGLVVLLVVLGLIGQAVGAGKASPVAANGPAPAVTITAAAPTVTQTMTVPGPEKTVTVATPGPTVTTTVDRPVTPKSCLDALADADKVITDAGAGFQFAADGFRAASQFDTAGVEAADSKISTLNPVIAADTARYQAARAACRGN